mgnify:CR=1 FL=1
MSRFLGFFGVLGVLSCSTSDKTIMLVNNPPEASIQSPSEAAEFIQYTPIAYSFKHAPYVSPICI